MEDTRHKMAVRWQILWIMVIDVVFVSTAAVATGLHEAVLGAT